MLERKLPKQWRVDAGFTLSEIAVKVGLSGRNPARTWHRWEQGQSVPPLHVILAFEQISAGQVTTSEWSEQRQGFLLQNGKRAA